MRSFWKVARLLPFLAVPKLWSNPLTLNSPQAGQQSPLTLEQNLIEVKPVAEAKVEQTSEKQEEKNDKIPEKNQAVEEKESKQAKGEVKEEKSQANEGKEEKEREILNQQGQNLKEKQQQNVTQAQSTHEKENETKPAIKQTIDSAALKPQQVLVSTQCPPFLLRYFQLVGYEPIFSEGISDPAIIKNSRNDTMTLSPSFLSNKHCLQILSNFVNPPQVVSSADQAKQLISSLSKDNFLITAYIPDSETYQSLPQAQSKSPFDNFTSSRKLNLQSIEKTFVDYAYASSSKKDVYVIARTKEVADFLKINTFNIGFPYVLNKTSKESGGESNLRLMNEKYKVRDVRKSWDFTKPIEKDSEQKNQINRMTHLYLNKIETEVDLDNKVKQLQMSEDKRKILLFCTQEKREEFHTKTEEILEKVARLEKDKIIVIKTSNQMAIKRVLKVEPDNFATIRLIDVHSTQTPLFTAGNDNGSDFLSRSKYRGPFKIQNLCDFVSAPHLQEYYESKKKVTTIKTVHPNELLSLSNTLVLFEKEGCEGCKYTRESLDELKKIIKSLNSDNRARKNLIYRFAIEDPQGLSRVVLRRYNIFNDNISFKAPKTTPKLFYFDGGKGFDLDVQKSLSKLNQVKAGQSPEEADNAVIADIIERIRIISQTPPDL